MRKIKNKNLFIFLDESGNFVFSSKGTEYLIFTALIVDNFMPLENKLNELKRDLILKGNDIEYFHASEDRQHIRDNVYDLLEKYKSFSIDSIVLEKRKTNPAISNYHDIYIKAYHYLIKYIFERHETEKVYIFTDALPHARKKESIKKGLKKAIYEILGKSVQFYIFHHSSKSQLCLQATDYCAWAIYKKQGDWGKVETRPYDKIKSKLFSEFKIFATGDKYYY